ncbi:MAG: ArnT family glycosyltransferase [Candidatus Hodarchaeota archaeon]
MLALAGAIRVYLYFSMPLISLDGAFQFIPLAELFAQGNLKAGLSHGQLPLYPILIALLSKTGLDFETSGRLVSLIFSLMTIFPLYFLGKKIFNAKIAFMGCMFFAIHPYFARFSVDVLKDPLYVFLFISSIWLGWEALEENKLYLFLIVGLLGGLTYLTRPDGLEIFLVMVGWILLYRLPQLRRDYVRRIWAILLLGTSIFLSAVPYIIYIHKTTGRWTISRTKHISALFGSEDDMAQKYFGRATNLAGKTSHQATNGSFAALIYLLRKSQNIFHPILGLLFLLGWIVRKPFPYRKGEFYLLSFFILHAIVLYLFLLNYSLWNRGQLVASHFSDRHFLPLVALSFSWMGVGFSIIYDKIANWIEMRRPSPYSDIHEKVFVLLLIILFASVLPKTLKGVRSEKLGRRKAGLWIKGDMKSKPTIITSMPRVAYYAHGELIYVPGQSLPDLSKTVEEKGCDYLVFNEKNLKPLENDFFNMIESQGWKRVYRVDGCEKILIYKRD